VHAAAPGAPYVATLSSTAHNMRAAAAACAGSTVMAAVAAALHVPSLAHGAVPPPHVEVGTSSVRWLHSFEAAKAAAKASGKPIFLQFTEVPG
jgi:hypothetical protein